MSLVEESGITQGTGHAVKTTEKRRATRCSAEGERVDNHFSPNREEQPAPVWTPTAGLQEDQAVIFPRQTRQTPTVRDLHLAAPFQTWPTFTSPHPGLPNPEFG